MNTEIEDKILKLESDLEFIKYYISNVIEDLEPIIESNSKDTSNISHMEKKNINKILKSLINKSEYERMLDIIKQYEKNVLKHDYKKYGITIKNEFPYFNMVDNNLTFSVIVLYLRCQINKLKKNEN